MSAFDGKTSAEIEATGLCARCRHVRPQSTKRGATFYRCARADEDDHFLRYPPIPVTHCRGFEAGDASGDARQSE